MAAMTFSGARLDRASGERADPAWVSARRADPEARALVVSEAGVSVEDGHLALVTPGDEAVLLGLDGGRALFAQEGGGTRPARPACVRQPPSCPPGRLRWRPMRRRCSPGTGVTASARTAARRASPATAATSAAARPATAQHFPRTDPVVIVRVTDPADRLLLGRQARWPPGRFSLLAGFVEPGETLEEAVRREVLEESGVEVEQTAYVASQPWPFPSSLMIGFSALAVAGEPRPGDDELEEVRWFERAEVEAAAAGAGQIELSPRYSISRRLIDAWLATPSAPDTRRRSS